MKTKNNLAFSANVNEFVESIKRHTDVISVETVDNITTITYEDWAEHPPIINTPRPRTERNNGGTKGLRRAPSEQARANWRKGQANRFAKKRSENEEA